MSGKVIPDDDRALIYALFDERKKLAAEYNEAAERAKNLKKQLKSLNNSGIGLKMDISGHSVGRLYKQYIRSQ